MQCLFRWILTLEAILRVLVCSRELIWMQNHTKQSSRGWKCWIRLSNLNSCEICNVFLPLMIFVTNFMVNLKEKRITTRSSDYALFIHVISIFSYYGFFCSSVLWEPIFALFEVVNVLCWYKNWIQTSKDITFIVSSNLLFFFFFIFFTIIYDSY